MPVQQLLGACLRFEVVVGEYAAARRRNPQYVLAGVAGDVRGEQQAFARPSGRAIRRTQLRHRGGGAESVPEPRLESGSGISQVALNERDPCHATQIYICMRRM